MSYFIGYCVGLFVYIKNMIIHVPTYRQGFSDGASMKVLKVLKKKYQKHLAKLLFPLRLSIFAADETRPAQREPTEKSPAAS